MSVNDLMVTEQLVNAHSRAVDAVIEVTDCEYPEAEEMVTAIVALVFETMKMYLPGENTCN